MHLLPKDVGLRVVDGRVIVDKLVDGAVCPGLPRLVKASGDNPACLIDFYWATVSAKDVRKRPQGSQVERQLTAAFRKQQNRAPWPDSMTDTEFVEDTCVRCCQIGDSILTEDKSLKQGFVDDPPGYFFVSPQRIHVGHGDRGCDQILVDGVEVNHDAGRVRFLSKGHENEAEGTVHNGSFGGIHSTGATRISSPWAVRRRAFQARRVIPVV